MLPKSLRLSIKDAALVRKLGKKITGTHLQLQFLPDPQLPFPRWLILVPKRVVPLSTGRNRARRIVGEALAILSTQATVKGSGIITVKRPLGDTLQPADILKQLEPLYKQAGNF